MMRLISVAGPLKGSTWSLRSGLNRVGRADDNQLSINDQTISGHHCEIDVGDFWARVRDLDSTNGTRVDGKPIHEAELRHGQRLTLGDMEFFLEVGLAQVGIPSLADSASVPAPTLEEGVLACLNHSELAATHECQTCGGVYCPSCVRELHLIGREARYFCPSCSSVCLDLRPVAEPPQRSFAGRLWDTIRVTFSRGGPYSKGVRPRRNVISRPWERGNTTRSTRPSRRV
jgi:hypothetical protein